MQTIFTTHTKSLNILKPENGTNNLYRQHNYKCFTINSTLNNDKHNDTDNSDDNYGIIFSNEKTLFPNNPIIFKVNLKIEKDINTAYYKISETVSKNDPTSYIPSNQFNTVDDIEIVWYNYWMNANYNKLRILLHAFDSNGNKLFGANVTGYVDMYGI